MGSHAKYLVEAEDLCCPVCKKPLSSPGTPPKPKLHKIGRGKGRAPHLHSSIQAQRDTRMAVGKFKDNEEIVIAQCGHLFHKFCLRHFCYLIREGRSNHMHKVCCPWCDHHISMSSQTVDYRAHQDRPNDRDKEYTKTSVMNNELSGQMISVKQKLQRVDAAIEDGNHNFEIYRSHWRKLRKELKSIKGKRVEIENLYSEIERSEQMLKCMQNQQLKIVKKFIMKVKEKSPKDFIHFPRRLSPFLQIIEEDDRLVRDLGEIIVPIHLNHLKSDRQSLLKGIIATVHEKLVAQGKAVPEMPLATTPEQQPSKKVPDEPPKKPAIFVKVRRSSISILSSASLTKESIQEIIETVDIPLHGSRKIGAVSGKKKVRMMDKASNNEMISASASDIKILYMPKRKMVEHTSEPCRTIEESESCAKVPARKCKSTDAVLVKTKKKEASTCQKISKAKIKSTIGAKRGSTAAVMSMSVKSANAENKTPKNVTCPATVNAGDKDSDIVVAKDEEKASINDEKDANFTSELEAGALQPETTKKPGSVPTSPTEPPPETTSLLKLIYDNLEEEAKSTHNMQTHRDTTEWSDFDENNNELLLDLTGKGIFSRYNSSAHSKSLATPPRPQFFRVDGRGIARPESPQLTIFREPTFLSSPITPNLSENSYIGACFQPDEENQMSTLTPEEKLLILSEHEAFLSSRKNCGTSARRPMFHGTPACLGLQDGQFHFGTPPDPQNVPFYLKKWQQQLASRKVLKAMPRRFADSPSIRPTRLVNSPKSSCVANYNTAAYFHPQTISTHPRHVETEKLSPSGGIHLPPLSMYPAKRPTTAQCDDSDSTPISYHHREGPEREISRIYNYDSVWK